MLLVLLQHMLLLLGILCLYTGPFDVQPVNIPLFPLRNVVMSAICMSKADDTNARPSLMVLCLTQWQTSSDEVYHVTAASLTRYPFSLT